MEEKSTLQIAYEIETINRVWEKARVIQGFDPQIYRKDICGAWIKKELYGQRDKLSMGWEIANFKPLSHTESANKRIFMMPMQWENYEKRGNDFPDVHCSVDASHFEDLKNMYNKS